MNQNPPTPLRVVHALGAMLFLVFAAVQYNDPDPVIWMLVYGLAAVSCIAVVVGRRPGLLPLMLTIASLMWFGKLFLVLVDGEPLQGEVGREAAGLLIVAGWMVGLIRSVHGGSLRMTTNRAT